MITKTTNRIHFEDLDPIRFEDLCFNLLYRQKNWRKLKHYGRSGGDEGIDIDGEEILNNGSIKRWHIQCKRHASFSPADVEKVINGIIKLNPKPDGILLIVSCSVSKKTYEAMERYTKAKGIEDYDIWQNTLLEAMLYNDSPDLLNIYFGLSSDSFYTSKVSLIEKRKRYRDDLKKRLLKPFNPSEPLIGFHRFNFRKVIIRSIFDPDDDTVQDKFGWYSYFGAEPYDIGDIGIEVDFYYGSGSVDSKNNIELKQRKETDEDVSGIMRALLPYENILTYDLNSGFGRPVFYCQYKGKLGPFDRIYPIKK